MWGPWIASFPGAQARPETNKRPRKGDGFQSEVIGEGGPRATEGSTGVCRRHTLTMTNGPGPTARVDTVDPPVDTIGPTPRLGSTPSTGPSCSGRRCRPATVLGSTVWTGSPQATAATTEWQPTPLGLRQNHGAHKHQYRSRRLFRRFRSRHLLRQFRSRHL